MRYPECQSGLQPQYPQRLRCRRLPWYGRMVNPVSRIVCSKWSFDQSAAEPLQNVTRVFKCQPSRYGGTILAMVALRMSINRQTFLWGRFAESRPWPLMGFSKSLMHYPRIFSPVADLATLAMALTTSGSNLSLASSK